MMFRPADDRLLNPEAPLTDRQFATPTPGLAAIMNPPPAIAPPDPPPPGPGEAMSYSPPAKHIWLVSQKSARVAHLAPAGPGIKQPICGRHLVLSTGVANPRVQSCRDCLRIVKEHARRP